MPLTQQERKKKKAYLWHVTSQSRHRLVWCVCAKPSARNQNQQEQGGRVLNEKKTSPLELFKTHARHPPKDGSKRLKKNSISKQSATSKHKKASSNTSPHSQPSAIIVLFMIGRNINRARPPCASDPFANTTKNCHRFGLARWTPAHSILHPHSSSSSSYHARATHAHRTIRQKGHDRDRLFIYLHKAPPAHPPQKTHTRGKQITNNNKKAQSFITSRASLVAAML